MAASDDTALSGVRGEAPWLRLPPAAPPLFARRAARLRALAAGHAAADWLQALALLADAQARAVAAMPAPALPAALASIVTTMRDVPLPAPARKALALLAEAPAATVATWAETLRSGNGERPSDAAAIFVGAALQACATARAAGLDRTALARPSDGGCPACGFAPVAGIVDGDDPLRYLSCGLCATEWHVTRVQCARCRTTAGITYYSLEGAAPGVKAETCAACRTYLKLFYRQELPEADPVADDAATLALDLLLGEEGWACAGINLLVRA
jgi:FdhE protein